MLTLASAASAVLLVRHGLAVVKRTPLDIEDVVEIAVCMLGAATASWLLLSGLLACLCLVARGAGTQWRAGERLVARIAPAVVRRLTRIGITATVSAGLVLPGAGALATDTAAGSGADPATSTSVSVTAVATPLDVGWTSSASPNDRESHTVPEAVDPTWHSTRSDAPAAEPAPAPRATVVSHPAPVQARDDRRSTAVVVLRGDSLWSIAANDLGPGASNAEIAAATERWITANSATIGSNPNLILPGMELRPPG
ncbi:hypothetical protein SAMN04489860_1216 [Paraoerskovia marina]|uniref:LysM domain-containing protein n=1 Tax=Paraoerskovia marina TaxID=545619 RepID=A0A1H1QZ58_9CELL|nr:hypothetical protein [Paraoerskovia marina]SDS28777.1 hypothetical protein SAMN04489860_1216 [Paraoerskovia marina]